MQSHCLDNQNYHFLVCSLLLLHAYLFLKALVVMYQRALSQLKSSYTKYKNVYKIAEIEPVPSDHQAVLLTTDHSLLELRIFRLYILTPPKMLTIKLTGELCKLTRVLFRLTGVIFWLITTGQNY